MTETETHTFIALPANSSYQQAYDQAIDAWRETDNPGFAAYWQPTGSDISQLRLAVCIDGMATFLDMGVLDANQGRYNGSQVWPEHRMAGEPHDIIHRIRMGGSNLSHVVGAKALGILSREAVEGFITQALAAIVEQAVGGRRHW